jgi:hypothetical protein
MISPELTPAEQLRQMREALMLINETMPKGYECRITELSSAALALTPSQAEQRAKANAEKAALVDGIYERCTRALAEPRVDNDVVTLIAICTEIETCKAAKEATDA